MEQSPSNYWNPFNSLFEILSVLRAVLGVREEWPFNSLFEIRRRTLLQEIPGSSGSLSILFLRFLHRAARGYRFSYSSPFNSLFEIPCGIRLSPSIRHQPHLSILFLRFGEAAGGGGRTTLQQRFQFSF